MEDLNALEQAVLDKLLSGEDPALSVLRAQAARARIAKRELSGVGFFCSFDVPQDVPRLKPPGNFHVDDVNAEVNGLKHGAGFVLFIRDGRIDMLEGFTYDEPWPREVGRFVLTYQRDPRHLPFQDLPTPGS